MSSAPVGTSTPVMVLQLAGDARRERHAARADADERQLVSASIALENLVRDARQTARDPIRVHDYRHGRPSGPGSRVLGPGSGSGSRVRVLGPGSGSGSRVRVLGPRSGVRRCGEKWIARRARGISRVGIVTSSRPRGTTLKSRLIVARVLGPWFGVLRPVRGPGFGLGSWVLGSGSCVRFGVLGSVWGPAFEILDLT